MGVTIASGTGTSIAANTKSSDQISGTYQFTPGDGEISVYSRSSATGLNIQLFVDGVAVMNDVAVPFFGTSGALSKLDHEVASISVGPGSRVEFYLRNTTAGAITVDFQVEFEPAE